MLSFRSDVYARFIQVRARLVQQEFRHHKSDELETRFGPALSALQDDLPASRSMRRMRLLRIMQRFSGDTDHVRAYLEKVHEGHSDEQPSMSRREHREELNSKYAVQLAELSAAGIHVHNPCIIRQLEKNQGDVNKVLEKMTFRQEKKGKMIELEAKYASQLGQLEADGVQVKNKRVLVRLLEKADGDAQLVHRLLAERQEKHHQRKDYRARHRHHSPCKTGHTGESDETGSTWRKRRELSVDDRDNLKKLRSAGVYGNPARVLALYHQYNESIEMTIAHMQAAREEKSRERDERKSVGNATLAGTSLVFSLQKHALLAKVQHNCIVLNDRADWPADIEQVYLDGNNMMFVVNSLRRLCLNRAGKKTERALGEIAAAWNEHMHIPNIDLIFDATRQVDQVGSVRVASAQPKYPTTDDMLVELARRPDNHEKNKRTIIVTSDRALAALVRRKNVRLLRSKTDEL